MTSDYQPIACGAYDEIEVLAMHKTAVKVVTEDDSEALCGTVKDTAIHDGAEFMVLNAEGERVEVRLDRIIQIEDASGRIVWRR